MGPIRMIDSDEQTAAPRHTQHNRPQSRQTRRTALSRPQSTGRTQQTAVSNPEPKEPSQWLSEQGQEKDGKDGVGRSIASPSIAVGYYSGRSLHPNCLFSDFVSAPDSHSVGHHIWI
jgi:hypothetical protein